MRRCTESLSLALVIVLLGLGGSSCHRTGDCGGHGIDGATASLAGAPEAASAGSAAREAGEEAAEVEQEQRLRQQGMAALAAYRASSCAAAIATIERLLQGGRGRWLERTESGALPGELVDLAVEAELWGSQSEMTCAQDDPLRRRFVALRSLLDAMWRYPTMMSKAQFEQRLRVLSE